MDDHEKLLCLLMESDKNIRFSAICGRDGKILWNSQRNEVTNILTLDETKKSLERAIVSWKSRDELSDKIGKGKYAIVSYEKIKRITIPLDDHHLLFVSIDNEGGKSEKIDDIITIVNWVLKHQQQNEITPTT